MPNVVSCELTKRRRVTNHGLSLGALHSWSWVHNGPRLSPAGTQLSARAAWFTLMPYAWCLLGYICPGDTSMLYTSVGCTASVKASANECVSERGKALSPWRGARPCWLCADCSRKGAAWCGFCCCGVGSAAVVWADMGKPRGPGRAL